MAGDDGGAQVRARTKTSRDGAVQPQIVEADNVQQAGDAAAGDDVAVHRPVQLVQHHQVGAVHGAVLVDVRADEVLHAQDSISLAKPT